MIQQLLENVPDNIVAFAAEGEVTEDDFTSVVIPAVKRLVEATHQLNYLMLIRSPLKQLSAGGWWQDMLLGIKELGKWNRAAILTDSAAINTFTNIFSVIVPGEFKGFLPEELDKAIAWVSGGK